MQDKEPLEYYTIRTKYKALADQQLQRMTRKGWQLVDRDLEKGRYGVVKTSVLGLIFLPLALAGRKADQEVITLCRPVSVGEKERADTRAHRKAQWEKFKQALGLSNG